MKASPLRDTLRERWRESRCWLLGLLCALVLHLGVVAAFMLRSPVATASASTAAFTLELAPTPSAPSVEPTQLPPGPPKIESVKSRSVPQPVVKAPPMAPLPLQVDAPQDAVVVSAQEAAEPQEQPAQDRDERQTTGAPAMAAAHDDALKAPVSGASGGLPASVQQTWETLILAHLEQRKRYPYLAQRAGQQDTVYVQFVLDRNGNVLSSTVRSSRGYAVLDKEALALLERASPLPPPPPEIEGERFTQLVPIEYFVVR